MKKSILIPTDFSQNAFNAVQYAFRMFQDEACVFYLYHTYYISASAKGNPLFPVPDTAEYSDAKLNVQMEMKHLKANISKFVNPEKHVVYYEYDYGFFREQLEAKAKKEQVDLIVMGTRGATDDTDVAFGHHTIDVMENLQYCPVLGVPKHVHYENLNEIVFATDFKGVWHWTELDLLADMGRITDTPIRIVHVGEEANLNTKQVENQTLLEKQFDAIEHSFHWVQDEILADGILHFVKERNSGMITFVNRKHFFFKSFFSNPLIKSLGLHAAIPLLTLHNPPK